MGNGVGDLNITVRCRSVIEIYEIKDAIKYIQGSVTTGALSNITGIPTNFKCTFKIKQTSTSSSFIGITIGTNSNNRILFGKTGSNGQLGIYVYNNGSSVASAAQNSVYQTNVEAETVYTYEDGVQTITANNVTKTLTNSSVTDRGYNTIEVGNSQCSDLIIEPL